jgi:TonB family protein
MLRDKRLDIGIVISIIVHIFLFIFLSGSGRVSTIDYNDIKEVTFIDQSYRPEVAKVISRGSVWSETKETYSEAEPSYGGEVITPAIDLSAKLDRSQAEIDLDRYLTDEDVGDVVKVGNRTNGTMKSTAEILAEKPISLAKNLPRGAGTEGGTGIGAGGIGRQAETPTIKIDKKPPPPKPSKITTEVETKVDEKIKVKKGETQISLAGPIANRSILNKVLPQYPSWALSKGISGVVKIRIWVEPSGDVREGTLIEISSGYPDLDQAVINALKKWRFAPLPSNVIQETQWGIITFRFVCG